MSRVNQLGNTQVTGKIAVSFALLYPSMALAQANKLPASTGFLQILAALAFVIFLMLALAWVVKRIGPLSHSQQLPMKVIGGVNLGQREKVIVVEVADQWLVLGVTPHQITKLTELQRHELSAPAETQQATNSFADWLKKTIDKRNNANN